MNGPAYDIGEDSDGPRSFVAADEVGLTLHYFYGDYNPINYDKRPFAEPQPYFPAGAYHPLYNGNISSMTHSIPARFYYQLYNYRYDQLNRLLEMDMYRGLNTSNTWSAISASNLYKERYSYDANGNITHALRNGNLSANPLMDSLTYFYTPGTNQLDYVRDKNNGSTAHSGNYGADVDIKDQAAANYSYDAGGNLQYDRFSGIDSITWNVYGKMQRMYKKDIPALSSATLLHNYYDPSGEKVGKATIYGSNTSVYNIYTWYVRDAQGNVMAVYQTSGSNIATTPLILLERYMYGSSRLGSISENRDMSVNRLTPDNSNANLGTAYLTTFTRGRKFFEVSNHLGTVMTILNDRHTPKTSGGVVTGYSAVMQFAADYTPFGMEMPGRAYGSSTSPLYRYKFNGKERIYEINGRYHQYDYGMRIYDDRLGRFFSVDPLTSSYPYYTPYQFAGNTPIQAIDLDGLEEWVVTRWYDKDQNVAKIRIFTVVDNKNKANHVNLHFKNKGDELAKGNKVLYLNLNAGTDKVFSPPTFGNALSKEERELFESNKKNTTSDDANYWTLAPGYKNYRTAEYDNLNAKFTEYNAFGQFKVTPPQKPEAIKETNNYGSSIDFWPSTASTKGSVQSEVNSILGLVKGKSDYSITILGNFNGAANESFNTKANILSRANGYKTYGDLALARANEIKGLLIDAGVDASKIKTQLGNPQGGMNANYIITTETEKK